MDRLGCPETRDPKVKRLTREEGKNGAIKEIWRMVFYRLVFSGLQNIKRGFFDLRLCMHNGSPPKFIFV